MRIYRSSRFKRSFRKLPSHIQKDFDRRIRIFAGSPFDLRLQTHKLTGGLATYQAFYLRDGFRVLFVFINDDTALLVNVGSHDDYAKWSKE